MIRPLKGMVLLSLLAVGLVFAPAAWGEVTLDKGFTSGEAQWYGGPDTHQVPCSGDWSAELSTFYEGDWAAVTLDCGERFTIDEVAASGTPSFDSRGLLCQTGSGVRMILLLTLAGTEYLAISDPAPCQTAACNPFTPTTWYYSQWDGSNYASYQVPETGPLAFAALAAALTGADVQAIGALMGVVDIAPADGNTMGGVDLIYPGGVIVDDFTLFWFDGVTTYGGTYALEQPWPDPFDFDDVDDIPPPDAGWLQWDQWTATGQWNLVHQSDLYGESATVRSFPSDGYAAYFGTANPNTGEGTYDGGGSRVTGCLTSPENYLNPADQYVDVYFDYYREVEDYLGPYPGQVYDKTYVQIHFDGAVWPASDPGWDVWDDDPWGFDDQGTGWKTIWYKDSGEPFEDLWQAVELGLYPDADGDPDPTHPFLIPSDATTVEIRFCFDSVDGYSNDYLGWLIDDVRKVHGYEPTILQILTDSLPQATVKVDYNFTLVANRSDVRWEVVVDEREGWEPLPSRLALDVGTGEITGHPEVGAEGTYKIRIKATWGSGHDTQTAEKTFYLAIRPPGGPAASNLIAEEHFDGASSSTWRVDADVFGPPRNCPNLWHETHGVIVDGVDITIGYQPSAYFGKDDITDPNYRCDRAKGCLVSQMYSIPAEFEGEEIVIGFKSWRQVESYQGEYDKTWVEVRFEGGTWNRVWEKDSSVPSESMWTWEDVHTGMEVPKSIPKVQVRFCFDSVDGYNNSYVGWLIDEVSIYAGSAMLVIVNECPMPDASVNHYYAVDLEASGGPTGNIEWEIIAGDLPPGLGIGDTPRWQIVGVPREGGTFTFTLKVTITQGGIPVASAHKECWIIVGEQAMLLFEDFEIDPQWSWGGLWHFTSYTSGVVGVPDLGPANRAAYYGKDDTTTPNYDTGSRTMGTLSLISPVIDLTGVTNGVGPVEAVKVSFDHWRQVEAFSGDYDFTKVQVQLDGGDWITIWEKSSADPSLAIWSTEDTVPAFLTNGAAEMRIRFAFDSVDKWYNNYVGWLVDNVLVEKADPAGAGPLSALKAATQTVRPRDLADRITVSNIPNPVRDVHTTTFLVRGTGIEAIRVQIFDLNETLVYEEEVPGNELVWHTENDYGEYLANGVYFYRAQVKIGSTWITTAFQKLVILR